MLDAREPGKRDQRDHLKILDFGIAKLDANSSSLGAAEGQNLTRMGSIYGTPAYMAPEQAMGLAVDRRADLYAVGVMLHEMITGVPPFDGDPIVVIAKQVNEPPPPLVSNISPESITPQVIALVDALLAKDREARPADAQAAITLLDAAVASLPVQSAATMFGETMSVSPRPPSATVAGKTVAGGGGLVAARAAIERRLEPLAKKTGFPVRQVFYALSGFAGLLVLLLLVLVFRRSHEGEDDISTRRHKSTTSDVAPTAPSAGANTSALASGAPTQAPTLKPTATAPTVAATGTTAPTGTTASGAPVKKKSGNSLANKIKSIFK
jgi:serine/threonine-protein kinase